MRHSYLQKIFYLTMPIFITHIWEILHIKKIVWGICPTQRGKMRYLYEYKNVKAENFSVRGIKKRRIGVPEQLDFPEKVVDFFRQYYCLDKMPEEYMYMTYFKD